MNKSTPARFIGAALATCAITASVSAFLPTRAWALDPLTNLAPQATVTASGQEAQGKWGSDLVIDGNKGKDRAFRDEGKNHRADNASRWSAENDDDVWVALDLGAEVTLDNVTVTWAKQYATTYTIEGSSDGKQWTELATVTQSTSAEEVTTQLKGKKARHIRIHGKKRSATYSMSIWEIEVYGTWTNGAPVKKPSVVPMPATYKLTDGKPFTLDSESDIVATGAAKAEAEKLAKTLRRSTGYELNVVDASTDDIADIVFTLSNPSDSEAYTLDASTEGVKVTAPSAHGLFNAEQTLYQLLGPWSTAQFLSNGPWSIPALHIEDAPRFEYRGIMLDPARSFLTVDEIKQSIDVMAMYKLDKLHLHLADDQGWRIEITNDGREAGDTIDYTRLTKLSGPTAMGTTDRQATPGVGGFYTQDDLRHIVAYAAERHIEIIPEIDVPGHSTAILHAIPQLNSKGSSHNGEVGKDGKPIADPALWTCAPIQTNANVGESYLDPDNPATWTFIKHVVKQVTDITQSDTIHIGGDEPHKMNTQRPGTHGPFLTKAAELVRGMGINPIGWNEWASSNAEVKAGDTIQFWNGKVADVSRRARENGAEVIWSNAGNAYFPQKAGPDVWGGTWATGIADLADFYNYDPTASANVPEASMRGVEGAMWFEHGRSIQDFFYPSYPRAMALAEVAWTPQANRQGKLGDLKKRIADTVPALTVHGADFYAKDGLVHAALVTATDITVPANGPITIARGYLPETSTSSVSAKVTWDNGTESTLKVSQSREYLPSNGNNNNNRAQNGLFELTLDQVPSGVTQGTVEFTANGKVATDTFNVATAKHTVTLSANGQSTAVEIEHGKILDKPADPAAPEGQEFVCWLLGDKPFDFATPITQDITLTAQFRALGQPEPEDPKPEDPKPENPKPEDPKPENPKPEPPITAPNEQKPQDHKPSNQKPANKPGSTKPGSGIPQTGDPAAAAALASAMLGSGGIAAGAYALNRRKHNQ